MGQPVLPHRSQHSGRSFLRDPRDHEGWKRKVCRRNPRFPAWRDGGSIAGDREVGVCVQCGERGVGGLLEEWGCVMSTCILPNSLGLSHAHQPIPLMACLKELS